jgi:redox-sensitive bicupin YhaK (pirin superfamily)
MAARRVVRVIRGRETSEGAGVRLRRTLGGPEIDHLDPFLLLDEFKSEDRDDYIAGFPDHPHRGFETVTYMLAGSMRHRDSRGNEGDLTAGSVQWMTAGRGIVHSEMPRQERGLMWGFQLWVNLPAAEKMREPRYQDIPPERVPEVAPSRGVKVRLVAGRSAGVEGPVVGIVTGPLYLDVSLLAGAAFEQEVPAGHNAFAYVFEGEAEVGPSEGVTRVAAGHLAVLGEGDACRIRAGERGARAVLAAGRPIGEPIVRYGPFVMNTREEILQAIADFREGRLA